MASTWILLPFAGDPGPSWWPVIGQYGDKGDLVVRKPAGNMYTIRSVNWPKGWELCEL